MIQPLRVRIPNLWAARSGSRWKLYPDPDPYLIDIIRLRIHNPVVKTVYSNPVSFEVRIHPKLCCRQNKRKIQRLQIQTSRASIDHQNRSNIWKSAFRVAQLNIYVHLTRIDMPEVGQQLEIQCAYVICCQ